MKCRRWTKNYNHRHWNRFRLRFIIELRIFRFEMIKNFVYMRLSSQKLQTRMMNKKFCVKIEKNEKERASSKIRLRIINVELFVLFYSFLSTFNTFFFSNFVIKYIILINWAHCICLRNEFYEIQQYSEVALNKKSNHFEKYEIFEFNWNNRMMFNCNKQRNHLLKIDSNKKFDIATTKSIRKFRDEVRKISLKLFAILINSKTK